MIAQTCDTWSFFLFHSNPREARATDVEELNRPSNEDRNLNWASPLSRRHTLLGRDTEKRSTAIAAYEGELLGFIPRAKKYEAREGDGRIRMGFARILARDHRWSWNILHR